MSSTEIFRDLSSDTEPGRPLAAWTYTNPELFELEYEALFLRRWQLVGHVNEVPEPGNYITHAIGRDNVFVIRGKDGRLRAFKNVCRHRASRVLEGKGECPGVIRCPYHGWTYQLDGSLMAIPQDQHFDDVDKSALGLHEVQLEEFYGLLFVRVKGDGPGLAEHFADMQRYFEMYAVATYVPCREPITQVWNVNWKVAWDNYLENYHIPIGHPSLHRLLDISDESEASSSGVDYGVFGIKSKVSQVAEERRYQELFPRAQSRLPEEIRNKWVQFGVAPNLGIDLYPEVLDFFQLIPLAHDRTLVRASWYGHPEPTPDETELRELNYRINDPVNDEDKTLCERVQNGLQTQGYTPGPLSRLEVGVYHFHEMLRAAVPVTRLSAAPPFGQVAAENQRQGAA